MQEPLKTYLSMAMGLTDVSRKQAVAAVKKLAEKGGTTALQVQSLTEELLSARKANRSALEKIIRVEVDRALGLVGLATAEEVETLTQRVRDLEAALKKAEIRAEATPGPVGTPPPVKKTATPKTVKAEPVAPAKKAAKKTVAKKAEPAPVKKTPAKKAVKASPGKKAAAKKTGETGR